MVYILYIIGYEDKIIGWIQSAHCNCVQLYDRYLTIQYLWFVFLKANKTVFVLFLYF